eukprot:scaffold579192_cov24-Prasinocladus_malaysianus.AAC.1
MDVSTTHYRTRSSRCSSRRHIGHRTRKAVQDDGSGRVYSGRAEVRDGPGRHESRNTIESLADFSD